MSRRRRAANIPYSIAVGGVSERIWRYYCLLARPLPSAAWPGSHISKILTVFSRRHAAAILLTDQRDGNGILCLQDVMAPATMGPLFRGGCGARSEEPGRGIVR
jgi:hypothetical protein